MKIFDKTRVDLEEIDILEQVIIACKRVIDNPVSHKQEKIDAIEELEEAIQRIEEIRTNLMH